MTRRVVVTGFGAVSALGLSANELWKNLIAGRSGLRFISSFDASHFPVKVAGELQDFSFDPSSGLSRSYQMLLHAAQEARQQANLEELLPQTRSGVFCARSIDWPELPFLTDAYQHLEPPAPPTFSKLSPTGFANYRFGLTSAQLGTTLGLAPTLRETRVTDAACASGGMVIGNAYQQIKQGTLDLALAMGTSSWTNLVGITIYYKLNALSTEAHIPEEASRPFDAKRKGFVMSEAAAVLVLEELEHALARQVVPLAEITGYGSSISAYRVTDLPPDGLAQAQCMQAALEDARRTVEEVQYINAHGTSTQQNDLVETQAIRHLFQRHAWDIAVSSNKSMLGHSITASGVLEAIATVQTLREQVIPPTINQVYSDPECDLDYVPNVARKAAISVALSNSFGFGGQNCSLVFEKMQ
jgi:3-oxoacyl-[acyl-carrier-protein] synthase II